MAVSPENEQIDTNKNKTVDTAQLLGSKTALRRGRYARAPEGSMLTLTPQKQALLRFLGECRLLSLPQLARLCCPSEQSARRHLRGLFDAGLVDIVAVSRSALSPAGATNDASLLHGSAPNLYVPTKAGLEFLVHAGLLNRDALRRQAAALGPKNSLFLAHELAVRDARVWLETDAAEYPQRGVLRWCDGTDAHLPLQPGALRQGIPRSGLAKPDFARPDAWFVYQIGGHQNASEIGSEGHPKPLVLVGLVEIDRGTERGSTRWGEKITDYNTLFGSQDTLRTGTGYRNARVLVFVPDARRRDSLADLILAQVREQGFSVQLSERFWLAEHSLLLTGQFGDAVWRRPGAAKLCPLIAMPMDATPIVPFSSPNDSVPEVSASLPSADSNLASMRPTIT